MTHAIFTKLRIDLKEYVKGHKELSVCGRRQAHPYITLREFLNGVQELKTTS